MHRTRRVPSADENKHPDEQIQEANKTAIVFDGSRLLRGRGDQRSLEFLAVADELVTYLSPQTGVPQTPRDLNLGSDGYPIDGNDQVARSNAGPYCGGIRRHFPGLGPVSGI